MTFDYPASRIELFELPADGNGFGGYAMCDGHADRLTAPVGWRLIDSRTALLTLFPVAELAPAALPAVDVA